MLYPIEPHPHILIIFVLFLNRFFENNNFVIIKCLFIINMKKSKMLRRRYRRNRSKRIMTIPDEVNSEEIILTKKRELKPWGEINVSNIRKKRKRMEKRFVSVREISEYLGLKESTVRDWVYRRKIPHHKFGRLLRFDLKKIDKWVSENKIEMN